MYFMCFFLLSHRLNIDAEAASEPAPAVSKLFRSSFFSVATMISCYEHTFPYDSRQRHFFQTKKIVLHHQPTTATTKATTTTTATVNVSVVFSVHFSTKKMRICVFFLSKKNDANTANGVESNHPNASLRCIAFHICFFIFFYSVFHTLRD